MQANFILAELNRRLCFTDIYFIFNLLHHSLLDNSSKKHKKSFCKNL